MKSSSKILPKSKPSIVNSLNVDNKKKTTIIPASDKRMTKIMVLFCSLFIFSNLLFPLRKKTSPKTT